MIPDIIRSALADRRIIQFVYHGDLRVIEPHLVGKNRKGHLSLSGYQLQAASGKGWRQYLVDEIVGLHALDEEFEVRPDFNPSDRTMSVILHHV